MKQLFCELKRRNVYRVAVTYAVVAFVVWQVADFLFPALGFPAWTVDFVVVLSVLGFPVALVLAWAFELTPEGVRRTAAGGEAETSGESGDESLSATDRRSRSRRAMSGLVGLGLVAAAVAGGWYLMGGGGETELPVTDRSVAVFPFETIGDTASSPFAEGLHTDLLTRLQSVSDLTVIARPSVMRYEDTEKPLARVAEELGAGWLVTAAVQSAGDQVQVNARLIDAGTDTYRWVQDYRRELSPDNVFDLQGEIAEEIAASLEAELSPQERERVERRPTHDLTAYQLYVQGRQQLAGRTFGFQAGWRNVEFVPSEHVQRAVGYFRRAIERDSSFALAWAGLADAAAWYPPGVPDSAAAPRVSQEAAARRALELDPNLAESHASMGFFHLANRDAPAAFRELTRALELKPSYWESHHWLGELYLKIGQARQALDHLTLAVELNPQHALARHWLYDAYLAAGQPEKSLREARRQQSLGLETVNAVAGEVRALYHLGRLDEARRLALEEIAKLRDQISSQREGLWPVAMRGHLAAVLAAQGDTAGARERLDWLRSEEADLFWIGFVHAAIGETDQALEAWEQMDVEVWGRIPAPHHLRYGVLLDLAALREDSRFQELIREANRAWRLEPDGSFPGETDSDE
jgi:TolB-like protein